MSAAMVSPLTVAGFWKIRGTLTWAGGAFNLGFHPYATTIGGGTIENDAGALFAIQCDGAVTVTSGATAFINGGGADQVG